MFIIKHKVDRSVDRFKVQLMAKGFTQTYGVDYQETFDLVVEINSIRILLSWTANLQWDLQQFDVKNVFLYRDLEEVYMEIPLSFNCKKTEGKVCWLKKILYMA